MRPGEFRVDIRDDGATLVVAPSGELDLATVDRLRAELERHAARSPLVLDLQEVSFMDSSGLALVLEQQRRAEHAGIDFRVTRGTPAVRRIFEVTGLERQMRWLEDQDGPDVHDERP